MGEIQYCKEGVMNICTIILSLFLSSPQQESPKGLLDCGFDEQNIYRCYKGTA